MKSRGRPLRYFLFFFCWISGAFVSSNKIQPAQSSTVECLLTKNLRKIFAALVTTAERTMSNDGRRSSSGSGVSSNKEYSSKSPSKKRGREGALDEKKQRSAVQENDDGNSDGDVHGSSDGDEEEDLDSLFGTLAEEKKKKKQKQTGKSVASSSTPKANQGSASLSRPSLAAAAAERNAKTVMGQTGPRASLDAVASGKFGDQAPSVHRYTPEGLPVYKYFHLGMQQDDGGTALCPFDCKCCF
jgi:hypothetical protein